MEIVERLRAAGCVFAEEEAALLCAEAGADRALLQAWVQRRVSGVPLEHILGWVDFAGLRIRLAPGVFVPRQRTAFLVDLAAERLQPDQIAVDVCCGSGAVAACLLHRVPQAHIWACDADARAVACARTNVAPAQVRQGDLFSALPSELAGRVAVITANAPYVPTNAVELMPPEARDYEPRHALDGGHDGVALHRRIANQAPTWLAPGGTLLLETSTSQAAATAAACHAVGLTSQIHQDAQREATVVTATHALQQA